ncbi:MAG: trypsin-like peptidase domain-containing protein [Marinobacter sp.]
MLQVKLVFLGLLIAVLTGAARADESWQAALELARDSVISIQIDAPVAFDTGNATNTNATGFVVDASRGIVLTNRHVIRNGPVVATGLFRNQEQVELTPLYRDPVHDFGFFQYDPEAVRYMQPRALTLDPSLARVGLDIRLVGNDAGEQLSIHAGTLARLDRNVPRYSAYGYNDFNTFYFQAATGTSGGSSGSPVLGRDGRVVALNAGGNVRSAASFYLPLDRVERALSLLQKGEPVSRGTLQTVFQHRSFTKLRELGLTEDSERQLRASGPELSGMLVASQVVTGGPAAGKLEEGDILLKADGELVTDFVTLAERLDNSVGGEVSLEIERTGKRLEVAVPVADMHGMEPDQFLELGGSVLHELSYQQTRNLDVPRRGLYLATSGYMFGRAGVASPSVITHINGEPVEGLDDFLQSARDAELLQVRYFRPGRRHAPAQSLVRIDRRWHAARLCDRPDGAAHWQCQPMLLPDAPAAPVVAADEQPSVQSTEPGDSLVWVDFDLPYAIEGVQGGPRFGVGLVVDAEQGLVVVDRHTVPAALGDARITVDGRVNVAARVVFMHPLHNLALLSFDPAELAGTPVASARLAETPLGEGESVELVGLTPDQRRLSQVTQVSAVRPLGFDRPRTARFQQSNLDAVEVAQSRPGLEGALFDSSGAVRALWASFDHQEGREVKQVQAGIPAAVITQMLNTYRDNRPIRSLEAKLGYASLARARQLGLTSEWIARFGDADRLLTVKETVNGTPAAEYLQSGDLLLAVDGQPVTRLEEVDRLSQAPELTLDLLRNEEIMQVRVETRPLAGLQTQEVLLWSGALLHQPHRAVAEQLGLTRPGVFIASRSAGSPAQRYRLPTNALIVAVDGQPVGDIEDFLARLAEKPRAESVLLHLMTATGRRAAVAVRQEPHYWPLQRLRWQEGEWRLSHDLSESAAQATPTARAEEKRPL